MYVYPVCCHMSCLSCVCLGCLLSFIHIFNVASAHVFPHIYVYRCMCVPVHVGIKIGWYIVFPSFRLVDNFTCTYQTACVQKDTHGNRCTYIVPHKGDSSHWPDSGGRGTTCDVCVPERRDLCRSWLVSTERHCHVPLPVMYWERERERGQEDILWTKCNNWDKHSEPLLANSMLFICMSSKDSASAHVSPHNTQT